MPGRVATCLSGAECQRVEGAGSCEQDDERPLRVIPLKAGKGDDILSCNVLPHVPSCTVLHDYGQVPGRQEALDKVYNVRVAEAGMVNDFPLNVACEFIQRPLDELDSNLKASPSDHQLDATRLRQVPDLTRQHKHST